MRRWRGSIRVRLLAVVTLLLIVGLIVANITAVLAVRSFALERIDQELTAVPALAPAFMPGAAAPEGLSQYLSSTVVARLEPSTGEVVQELHGPTITGVALPDFSSALAAQSGGESDGLITLPDRSGTPNAYRARVVTAPGDATASVVVIARSLREVQETVRQVAATQIVASALLLAILIGTGVLLLRVSLRPLTEVQNAALRIGDGDLSVRVPHANDGNEAADLAGAFNSMVDQIQEAFDSQAATEDHLRQFVADASHELRTPLTSIRAYAELINSGVFAADPDVVTATRRIEAEAIRMGLLVDDLLLLAQFDHGPQLTLGRVDLAQLAADVVTDCRAYAPEHQWSLSLEGDCVLVADADRLTQLVSNLTRNAAVHTPAGTTVHVLVSGRVDTVEFVVWDDGPGMTPAQVSRAFDRFYRADAGRARTGAGSGLGLSIVSAVATAHEGSVELTSDPEGGTKVAVRLPRHVSSLNEREDNPQDS